MNVIGIDPGLTGALALLHDNGDAVVDVPVRARLSGKGKELDLHALVDIVDAWLKDDTVVYLEQVSAMPGGGERKMGATGAFSFGRSTGQVEGVLATLGAYVVHVRPQAWKKRAGLSGKPKPVAVTLAQNLFPHLRSSLVVKRLVTNQVQAQGRADALLIAKFGGT